MRHPAFTWWPWGLLALVVPGVAAYSAFAYVDANPLNASAAFVIMLSVLAAGNAYIIAIAGGRLSNLVLSIPIGAAMGLIAGPLLALPGVLLVYLLILFCACFGYAVEYIITNEGDYALYPMVRVAQILVLTIGGLALFFTCVALGASGLPMDSPLVVVICYPFLIEIIAVAFSVRSKAHLPEGFVAGFRAALSGMLKAGMLLGAFYFIAMLLGGGIKPFSGLREAVAAGVLWLTACNYFAMKNLFPVLLRAPGVEKPVLTSNLEPVLSQK